MSEFDMAGKVALQFRLKSDQLARLRQEASELGINENEFIRQAIDQYLGRQVTWQQAMDLMRSLQAQGPLSPTPPRWTRDELYQGREDKRRRNPE